MCLEQRYQDTTAPYVLEPWCIPVSSKEFVDFDTYIFLCPIDLVLQPKHGHLKHLYDHNKTYLSDPSGHNSCNYKLYYK